MAESEEVNAGAHADSDGGGFGGRYERAESGLTRNADDRLTLRAAAWQRGRWDTGLTEDEIRARIAARGGQATLKEKIALKAFEGVGSDDHRASRTAMRAALQMEAQNQRDELASLNSGQDPTVQGAAPLAPDQIASAMDASIPNVAAG